MLNGLGAFSQVAREPGHGRAGSGHRQPKRVDPHRGAAVDLRWAELDHRIVILVADIARKNFAAIRRDDAREFCLPCQNGISLWPQDWTASAPQGLCRPPQQLDTS